MKRAIISDIHGNLQALEAVLQDIVERETSVIYCLGDIVGYGANPLECLEHAMKFRIVLLGNHDEAAMIDPSGFNAAAMVSVHWTREQLNGVRSIERRDGLWAFLGGLPKRFSEKGNLYVHGSPLGPTNNYVFPEDANDKALMARLFSAFTERVCFQGHTHVPGVFTKDAKFYSPEEMGYEWNLAEPVMVNVGSVGQPRDRIPAACYVVFDDVQMTVQYHRVAYSVDEAAQRIFDSDLDDLLGHRLKIGR